MKADEIDAMLRETLQDQRFSRGERRAIREHLGDMDASDEMLAHWRRRAFEVARSELRTASSKQILEWLEGAIKAMVPHRPGDAGDLAEAHFAPGDQCATRIIGCISGARRALDICVFTITDDRITDAVLAAHERHVSVRVITDDDKAYDRGSDVRRLERAGIKVRVDATPHHMHHKFALFDGHLLATGSYNWTRSAARHNQENLIVTDEPKLVAAFSAEFERLWEEFG